MRKFLSYTIFIIVSLFIFPLISGEVIAGLLKFDKDSVTVGVGGSFQIAIIVDAGSDQITSTDAYMTYDPTLLEAVSVAPGTYFPTVPNNLTSGKVYVAGLVDDAASYKTSSGILATVTFKTLKGGTGTLTFDCQAGSTGSKIIKNDTNATNLIQCEQNTAASVSVAGGTDTGGTVYPTPSALPKTGIVENIAKFAVPGAVLLIIGGMLRLVL